MVPAIGFHIVMTTKEIDTFCQNSFFRDWAPYGRWGGHRTVRIGVVAMRAFFIISQKEETVFWPVDVSMMLVV